MQEIPELEAEVGVAGYTTQKNFWPIVAVVVMAVIAMDDDQGGKK